MQSFNLEQYLNKGVETIVKGAIRTSLSNPKERIFMAKYAIAQKKASAFRKVTAENGEHIPPFLIASITSQCNLHCVGCYARSNQVYCDGMGEEQLSEIKWASIFDEATEIGIGFILLAGGEPFMRMDIIKQAGKKRNILFPVFTNGTLIDNTHIKFLEENRNIIPIISMEGGKEKTDNRRGMGIYEKLAKVMEDLQKNQIMYGASVTVTKENLIEVRNHYNELLFISFPGDEKASGLLSGEHAGGCVLFEKENFVQNLMREVYKCSGY